MKIDPKYIHESEQLFIKGNTFDQERLDFINNLDTCDLLAVPGSGKTTALMAKLYSLSKKLPFDDGSGILVLAHTNAAVDEIEKKLKPHCPRLFEYPNFVGTIQGFVNKFLANNANFEKYGSYIVKNDDDAYMNEAKSFFYSLKWSKKGSEDMNLINKLIGKVNIGKKVTFEEAKTAVLQFILYFELDILNRKIYYNQSTFYTYEGSSQKYYLELERWREDLLSKGILTYKDSFYLAWWYLNKHENFKFQLQHRFKYVFIDETQDLDNNQIDLIDNIFFTEDSKTVIQRVGDINQAIYSAGKKVKVECDWISRETIDSHKYKDLYVTGSNRLTKSIAEIVDCFTLNDQDGKFKVEGKRILSEGDIPPFLILFDKETKGNTLKEEFGNLIKYHKLNEIEEAKNGFKIIGWVGEKEDESKLCLNSYFGYTKKQKLQKDEFDSLSEQLCLFANKGKTLKEARQSLLNALIYILKLENLKIQRTIRGTVVERYYNCNELINHIKANQNAYESFKKHLYEWSFNLTLKKDIEELYESFSSFINSEFKDWFVLSLNSRVQGFIGAHFLSVQKAETTDHLAVKQKNDVSIEVATVHSVKGQTHCATMYVETDYYKYETQKLRAVKKKATKKTEEELKPNPLFKQRQNYELPTQKQALKMMYVGFSRPTHLLCFAAIKENVEAQLSCFQSAGWEIIDITKKK